MAKGFQVAPVEGRTIVDPFNTRHSAARTNAPQRRIGFTRIVDAEKTVIDPRSGKPVPAETWEAHGKPEIVRETSDGFYARAIKDGDLDYLGSVDVADDGTTKPLPLDRELLKATAVNKVRRAHFALAEKVAAEKAASEAEAEAQAYAEAAAAAELKALTAKPAEKAAAKPEPAEPAQAEPTTTPESAA